MRLRPTGVIGTVLLTTVLFWSGVFHVVRLAATVADELASAGTVQLTPRPQSTVVFDRAGREAFTFFAEQRIDVPLDRMSPRLVDAVLAIEDRRFFRHHGIDPLRIAGAALRNLRAGRIREGGSTITQQLARAIRLTPVRTYDRKLREILLAAQIERRYSKPRILEQYLNTVYLGDGYYGVEAASRGYFHKPAADLDVHEAALLAALVRSPSSDAPSVNPTGARQRRDLVLRLMRDQGRLNDAEFHTAAARAVPTRPAGTPPSSAVVLAAADGAPQRAGAATGLYFQEEVRRQLVALFGSDTVLRGGLRVFSTYDPAMQREAERALTTRIADIIKARRAARDLQGSFVAMDPVTGDVRALVGGRDFNASSFNRATQARRQAGSAFKPIIYAAALERGFAPGTMLRDLDTPIGTGDAAWLPGGSHEESEYTLRAALRVSSNRAAAQLLQTVGVSTAVYYAQRLGIASPLPQVPSLALGTGEVTLMELTAAYTAFANAGRVAAPRIIIRVEDGSGSVLYDAPERHTQAVSATTAFLMSSMLGDVISGGTGAAARRDGFTLPAAGKTGTTDDYADAWFVGYTPHLVAGVWFGLDRPAPIMRGGFAGVVAVPAWARFMKAATAGDRPDWYATPPDVEKVSMCRLSGARATEACRHQEDVYRVTSDGGSPRLVTVDAFYGNDEQPAKASGTIERPVYEDLFPLGSVPAEPCPLHSPASLLSEGTVSPSSPEASSLTAAYASVQAAATRPPAVIMEKIPGPDGVMRIVLRQGK